MNRRFLTPSALYCLGLAVLLGSGLYLRWDGLGQSQHFQGDQGRDYLEVMRWLWDGHWPLLGTRRITGDYTIGPGWYYTIAPALALSGFHPAAGAAMVGLLGLAAALLGGEWIRRATGSRLAALTVVAVYAWSERWVFQDRMLWNPHALPLGVAGLALAIFAIGRRPVAGLALCLMLLAILPQWHTTGYMVVLAAAPFIALAFSRVWRAALALPRRAWARWGGALALCVALLYGPPLIYELRPGPGNLSAYFRRTVIPGKTSDKTLAVRAAESFERLATRAATQALPAPAVDAHPRAVLAVAALLALLAAALLLAQAHRNALDPSAGYLLLLCLGFVALLTLKGDSIQDYFLTAFFPASLLLSGWVMGHLLQSSAGAPSWRLARRIAGGVLAALFLALSIGQLPQAWILRQPQPWQRGQSLGDTIRTAKWIIKDAGRHSFSVGLLQEGNYPAHYLAVLRWLGRPARNTEYLRQGIRRPQMGERIYLVDLTAAGPGPFELAKALDPPVHLNDACRVWSLPVSRLDPSIRELKLAAPPQGPWSLSIGKGRRSRSGNQ